MFGPATGYSTWRLQREIKRFSPLGPWLTQRDEEIWMIYMVEMALLDTARRAEWTIIRSNSGVLVMTSGTVSIRTLYEMLLDHWLLQPKAATSCDGQSVSWQVWQLCRFWLGFFLVMGIWPSLEAQAQAISVSWFRFDPIAVRRDRTDPVVYKTLINGNPSSVQFVLAAGGTVPLSNEGGGVWSVTLTAQQVLFGYLPDNASHNFVGFLDIFQGGTQVVRFNEFIGVVDENVSDVSSQVQNQGNTVRISQHVVNFWQPNRTPGVPTGAEIQTITQQFYQVFQDDYDFLNLVFALPSSNNNRFHFGVKNEVDGIGVSRFNNTGAYGSSGRLQGISVFPIDSFFDMADTGALHETGHQWINFSTLPVLRSGSPHWPVSSLARGIMGFNLPGNVGGNFSFNLVPLPNGDYRLEQTTALREFTDLDLYLMGLLPASEVGSHIVFENQSQQLCNGCILSGPVVTVTVGDVIAAQGPRRPDVSTSRKMFRVATIIVTKERLLNDDELALFDYFAARGEAIVPLPFSSGLEKGITKPFYLATRGKGSLVTQLYRPTVDFKEVLTGSPGQPSVLAAGVETGGLARGPAFQIFNPLGTLQTTQFVLNPDFGGDVTFALGNFDADGADEVLVGSRETSGLARGPAYQLFDTDGAFKFTRFVLNPDFNNVSFSSLNVGSNGVLVCGQETSGLSRGPAYQAFDASGNLVRTQFVLNPDFTADNSCTGTNLDGVAGDEVIMGGREVTGLARGPAFQVFGSDGSFRLTGFALNPDFRGTKFAALDVGGSKEIIVSGRETAGLGRGPAYQLFDANGNLILTRFVLNPDFTDLQIFGANTTSSVVGDEIVSGGTETSGLVRGPAFQIWDKNGDHLFTRFVLNPDFTEVKFTKIDINNDGVDEILVVGRETKGLQRGPAFQLFDGSGSLLVTQFVLNGDFTNVKAFAVDHDGDGDKEIGVGGTETKGLLRGPAYQIFESNGTLVQTRFVLNPDF